MYALMPICADDKRNALALECSPSSQCAEDALRRNRSDSMNIPFIILLAVCVAISGYAGRLFFIGRRSRSWPSVQGTITTSRIDHVSAGRSGVAVVFVLEYSYAVNGQGYSGNRVAV